VSEKARNEALDIRVYNIAALHILNPNWKSLRKRQLAKAELNDPRKFDESETDINSNVGKPKTASKPKRSFVNRSGKNFVRGWK